MATGNKTNLGALLKELYTLPPVRALNDKSFLHDKLTKQQATMDFSGKYAAFPVTLIRNLGRGSRGDGGVLPTAGNETVATAQVYMKQHYYALEWTEAVEVASKNTEGAFESVVTMKLKNVSTDMAKEINRQWYNAANGQMAAIAANGSSVAQLTVDSTQYLRVGDTVDIVAASNGAAVSNGTARVVASIDSATQFTVSGSANLTVTSGTHIVVISGNYGNEIQGIRHIANTGRTLHGIDSTTAGYQEWDGNVLDASNAIAGEDLFEQAIDLVGKRGRGELDTFITTRGIRRRLANEFASQRRYLDQKAQELHLGYQLLEVSGKTLVIDDDCPKFSIFGLSLDSLKVLQATQPGWFGTSADGRTGEARIEIKDDTTAGQKQAVFQAWYRYHATLCCQDPGRNVWIKNCADEAA